TPDDAFDPTAEVQQLHELVAGEPVPEREPRTILEHDPSQVEAVEDLGDLPDPGRRGPPDAGFHTELLGEELRCLVLAGLEQPGHHIAERSGDRKSTRLNSSHVKI